jgi:hypothetical protein
MKVLYLTADRETIAGTLKSVAEIGLCSLMIFRHVFPQRFDLLGIISETLTQLRGHL